MRPLAILLLLTAVAGCQSENDGIKPAAASKRVEKTVRRLDGSTLDPQQIAETVQRVMSKGQVTGLALAILNDGEIVYLRAFGLRDAKRGLPLTETSVMSAASFSKAIFAFLVMQLVDEGQLDLDKPVHEYLAKPLSENPKYRDIADDERAQRLTARMLLSHAGGLPNWRWLNSDHKLGFHYEPGERYAYSGEGFELLQLAVEEITGQPLDELVRQRVLTRLGMQRTDFVWRPEFAQDFALGYAEDGRQLDHKRRETASAAGSADSDITGIALFMHAMLRGDALGNTGRVEMLSPQIRIRTTHQFPTLSQEETDRDDDIQLGYGLGWGLFSSPYGKAFFKEGHDDGWEHYMVAFDDPKTAIILMTNSSNGESVFRELLATLIGDEFTPWEWNRYVPYDRSVSNENTSSPDTSGR